jgi:hypothetical protein
MAMQHADRPTDRLPQNFLLTLGYTITGHPNVAIFNLPKIDDDDNNNNIATSELRGWAQQYQHRNTGPQSVQNI